MKCFKRLIITLLILFITSCTAKVRTGVCYTVYPVGYLIQTIAGDVLPINQIQENELIQIADPVDNIEQLLGDSIFLFRIGELENYLTLMEQDIDNSGITEVDLSSLNAIYNFNRYTCYYVDGERRFTESPYYNDPCFDLIDTYDKDLYLWLDPISMLSMAKDVYVTLSSNYVEYAATFKANYDKLEEELISLDADYQKLSNRLKSDNLNIKFVSMTASFGSWQKAYGFQVYPVCLSRYGSLPSAQQLELIKQRIVDDGVRYIAYEPNMSEEMIELFNKLESELGLTRVNLSNISSLTDTQIADNKNYLSIMYENLDVLENIAEETLNSSYE
jgi:zinc transport system substrate-binding protein